MENLSNGQKISIGAGAVLLISSFLPWYGVDFGGLGGISIKAWSSGFFAWGGVVLGVAGVVLIAMKAFQNNAVSAGGFATEQLAVILTALGTVFILLRLITETNFLKFGIFIGLASAAIATFGAYSAMNEQGMDLDSLKGKIGDAAGDLKDRVSGDDDEDGGGAPTE